MNQIILRGGGRWEGQVFLTPNYPAAYQPNTQIIHDTSGIKVARPSHAKVIEPTYMRTDTYDDEGRRIYYKVLDGS